MGELFTAIIYQPFLNILVFFYWALGVITGGKPDMGIAVILLTILIRVLLLPLTLMEDHGEKDRRDLVEKAHLIEKEFAGDPIQQRKEMKRLFHRKRSVVVGEFVSLVVQVVVALMLWRMFETGLPGEDVHLLYSFMPQVELPFNLIFLGSIDLTHTNFLVNVLQSFLIFLVETLAILTSPYPPMKGEVVRLQLVLPIISFIVFLRFPAGKKIFVITTLVISLGVLLYKFIRRKIRDYADQLAEKQLAELSATPPEQKIVVETK